MRYYLQWSIAYAFALASAAMASLFGFMSSVGPYAYAKAIVLCLVAFAGCHGPAWASRLRQAYGVGAAFLGGLAAFACLIVTLWGGLGTMASGGAELKAERVKASADATRDRATLARALAQRQQMPAARPSAAVRPLLALAREGTPYKAKLDTELATALEAERLDGVARALEARLQDAPPETDADPEASAFSQLTRGFVSVPMAAALKALLVSLALEAAAMVAMLVAWAEKREVVSTPANAAVEHRARLRRSLPQEEIAPRRSVAERPSRTAVILPIPKVFGSIKKFAEACIAPAQRERLEVKALVIRYQNWCKEGALPPADLSRFLDEIEKLYTVELVDDRPYVVNVRLAA